MALENEQRIVLNALVHCVELPEVLKFDASDCTPWLTKNRGVPQVYWCHVLLDRYFRRSKGRVIHWGWTLSEKVWENPLKKRPAVLPKRSYGWVLFGMKNSLDIGWTRSIQMLIWSSVHVTGKTIRGTLLVSPTFFVHNWYSNPPKVAPQELDIWWNFATVWKHHLKKKKKKKTFRNVGPTSFKLVRIPSNY